MAELAHSEGEAQRALAHRLKGSALALGLDDFAAQCAAVEQGLLDGGSAGRAV